MIIIDLLILLSVAATAGVAVSTQQSDVCVGESKVATIGACSSDALCKVVLENGEIRTERYPAIGEPVCYSVKKK